MKLYRVDDDALLFNQRNFLNRCLFIDRNSYAITFVFRNKGNRRISTENYKKEYNI